MEKITKKEADREAEKIFKEHNIKVDEIIRNAKENGTWEMGLDSNRGLFKKLEEETKKKLKELASRIEES